MSTLQNGKGSWPPRNCGTPEFRDGWDAIFNKNKIKDESISQEESQRRQSTDSERHSRDNNGNHSQFKY